MLVQSCRGYDEIRSGRFAARIRWRIFSFLFGFGFLAYVQQKTITVAAERMMPELGLSQLQIGWLEQAFVLGYAIFQMPGGVFGQRVGARRTFVIIGLTAFLATIATPLAPELFAGPALFVALLGAQLLLGCSQGAIFPVSAGVFEAWFPPNRWCLRAGFADHGSAAGRRAHAAAHRLADGHLGLAARTGVGERAGARTDRLVGLVWPQYAARTSRGVRRRNSRNRHHHPRPGEPGWTRRSACDSCCGLLRDRNVLLLGISYMCMNYTFYLLSNWVFLYLVQERKFSLLESGWLATAPPLAAALGAGIGRCGDQPVCRRFGNRWGFRLMPLLALPASAALLLRGGERGQPLSCGGGARDLLRLRGTHRGGVLGRRDDRGPRRYHGRVRIHEHGRQSRRYHRHPHRCVFFGPAPVVRRVLGRRWVSRWSAHWHGCGIDVAAPVDAASAAEAPMAAPSVY